MFKIKNINLARLRKLELPDLAEKVIRVIEEHDPELLKLNDAYELLIKQQPNIDILKLEYGPHLITPEVDVLKIQRGTFAGVIFLQTRALSHNAVEGNTKGVKAVRLLVNLHLKNLRRYNEKDTHQKLSEFFRKIDEDEVLETAFSTLGLTKNLNDLRNVHASIDEQLEKRDSSLASRPSSALPPIKAFVRRALSNMISQINLAQSQNVDLDYSKLVAELNRKIVQYVSLVNMRATIRAKKKADAENAEGGNVVVDEGTGETETPAVIPTETPTVTPTVTPTAPETNVQTTNLNVEEKGSENVIGNALLNKEKTAASSSKNSQLPSSSSSSENKA